MKVISPFVFLLVALVNSQIVLKGIESEGCVLVAAGNAKILNRLHTPVWSKGELFNKKTWVGNVENLQVFTEEKTQASNKTRSLSLVIIYR